MPKWGRPKAVKEQSSSLLQYKNPTWAVITYIYY